MTPSDKEFLKQLYMEALKLEDNPDFAFNWAIKRYTFFQDRYMENVLNDIHDIYGQKKRTEQ